MDLSTNKMFAIGAAIVIAIGGFFLLTKDSDEMEAAVAVSYTATITNTSDSQVLSPGVYVVHTAGTSLNYDGEVSDSSLETLAEVGNPEAFAAYIAGVDGVSDVITIDDPVMPGATATISFMATGSNLYLSGVQMAVGSNDGYALLDSLSIADGMSADATNWDNGSEENSPLGSGFEGGQPDPAMGAANLDNGEATDPQEATTVHPQLTDAVMSVSLSAN